MDEKKAEKLPALSETVLTPDANDPEATVLELDELWSFVLKKTNKAWIWIALCRKTRQVVAYAIGDRSEKTCRILWEAIPEMYRAEHCFTDFWAAYQAVIRSASNTQQWARKQVRQHMSSAGITRCGNVWLVSFAKRSPSQNPWSCMIFVYASSSIATIWNEPAFSCDPLPRYGIEKMQSYSTINTKPCHEAN